MWSDIPVRCVCHIYISAWHLELEAFGGVCHSKTGGETQFACALFKALKVGLPYLTNKNTSYPVRLKFPVNNKQYF